MRKIIKLIGTLAGIGIVVMALFLGYTFLKANGVKKDLESAESLKFEIMYHISGDSDIFGVEQYMGEDKPLMTKWMASYIRKMENGGRIQGEMYNDIYHANVFAENENSASIEFFYDKEAVFGIKKTMDYIIDMVEQETGLSISMLKELTPDGYITLKQIKTILGEESAESSSETDLIEQMRTIIKEIRLVLPCSVKSTYYQDTLESKKMIYCSVPTSLETLTNEKIILGICDEEDTKYLYIRINDIYGKEDRNLEMLLYIELETQEKIVIPEVISDEVIDSMGKVIGFMNNMTVE